MDKDQVDEVLKDWAAERPDLDNGSLGIVLRLQFLAKRFLEQVTAELSSLGLEWWEYDVLSALRRQGEPYRMPATSLAEESRLSAGAMTHRIDRLENKKLVTRTTDDQDRRRVIVQLTKSGKTLIDQATEARFAAAEQALETLSTTEHKQLGNTLRKLLLSQEPVS